MNTTQKTRRKIALGLSALAIAGMAGTTVACSPRAEKPVESSTVNTDPTEKAVRTNVTRAPIAATPQNPSGGGGAVPCGYGPQGGAGCGRHN